MGSRNSSKKLFGINLSSSEVSGVTLHFGRNHDSKYGRKQLI
jgi:hypothetical protein